VTMILLSFPTRRSSDLINEHNVTKFFLCHHQSCRRTGKSGSNYGNFLAFVGHVDSPSLDQSIFLISSSPNSLVFTSVAPSIIRAKSYVTTLEAIVLSIAFVIRLAASLHSRCSSISTAERMTEDGFTLSMPAYLGAVP